MFALYYILIFISLVGLAFFCAAETAIMSASRVTIQSLVDRRVFGAKNALKIFNLTEEAIGMTLIGTNISHISATALVTFLAKNQFGANTEILIAISVAQTILFLLFCELLPKIIARAAAAHFVCYTSYIVLTMVRLLFPFITFFLSLSKGLKKLLKIKGSGRGEFRSRDEVNILFMLGEKSGVIKEDYKAFVDEILEMNHVLVKEIMTPTIDIISVEKDSSIKSVISIIDQTHYSRVPVFEERVDNITGYIYYKDLFDKKNDSIDVICREPYYVPETKLVYDLYKEMLKKNIYIVFVVNEYGAITGLATREDVAEEIFGEIQTRDHRTKELVSEISKGKFNVSGSLDIDIFEKLFTLEIDKKNFDTVAGFIMSISGRIPAIGEKFTYGGYLMTVEKADSRMIKTISVRKSA